MNLFEIGEEYFSHPNYPYITHIKNIADSFENDLHRLSSMYHDLGKLCNDFQTYINPNHPNLKKTKHALIGALLFLSHNGYKLNKKNISIFISIFKHHGNLEDVNKMAYDLSECEDILYEQSDLIKKLNEISSIIKNEIDFELDNCCDFFDCENFVQEKKLSGIDSYFKIKETFSKLVFADKYEAIFKKDYNEIKPINHNLYLKNLVTHISQKDNELTFIRNTARKEIIKNYNNNKDKQIFIIEAPTGIGKTFTALNLALKITEHKKGKRIVVALPMTSIIDQTYEEYAKIFDKETLLKYHYLTQSKSYKQDNDKELDNEQEYYKQKDSFLTKSWAEDNIIITTFNQLLNLFYSHKNSDLIKFWTLRNSVVIFDEIQAIPRLLLKDFAHTINFLSKFLKIHFVLMSATVPEIKQFLNQNITCELLDNKYFTFDFNNRYALSLDNKINNKKTLIEKIIKQQKKGNSILTVLNSKKLALDIFNCLENNLYVKNNLFLLSSYFIPKHRKEIIKKVTESLQYGKKPILISTQVVEAGVDLDFDFGFREFSPLYSIIQTAGRINRENRLAVKSTAELVVFPPIGYSPYHQTDLLEDIIFNLLSKQIRENNLLPLLKKYFLTAFNRTPREMLLIKKMENLDFQEVQRIFNNNFMKESPTMVSLFIEIENGLYNKFRIELDSIYQKLEDKFLLLEEKMELKTMIKSVYKQVAQYVISVPRDKVLNLDSFYRDSEMKVCPHGTLNQYYHPVTGFKLDSVLPEKTETCVF